MTTWPTTAGWQQYGIAPTKQLRKLDPQAVGGTITDAVFSLLNPNACIAICGQISQYNNTTAELAPRNFRRFW